MFTIWIAQNISKIFRKIPIYISEIQSKCFSRNRSALQESRLKLNYFIIKKSITYDYCLSDFIKPIKYVGDSIINITTHKYYY